MINLNLTCINLQTVKGELVPYIYKNFIVNFVKDVLLQYNKKLIKVDYYYPISEVLILSAVSNWFLRNSDYIKNKHILKINKKSQYILSMFNIIVLQNDIWTLQKIKKVFIDKSNRIQYYYPKYTNQKELDVIFNKLIYLTNILRVSINEEIIFNKVKEQKIVGKYTTTKNDEFII